MRFRQLKRQRVRWAFLADFPGRARWSLCPRKGKPPLCRLARRIPVRPCSGRRGRSRAPCEPFKLPGSCATTNQTIRRVGYVSESLRQNRTCDCLLGARAACPHSEGPRPTPSCDCGRSSRAPWHRDFPRSEAHGHDPRRKCCIPLMPASPWRSVCGDCESVSIERQ